MTPTEGGSWADWAQVAAALFAGLGLLLSAYSTWKSARATDALTLQSWHIELANADRRFKEAVDTPDFEFAFYARVNLLEVIAASVNNRLFGKTTTKMLGRIVANEMAIIDQTPGASFLLSRAIDSDETFAQLYDFSRSNRRIIEKAKHCAAMKRNVHSS